MKYPVFIIIGLTARRGRRRKGKRGGGERIRGWSGATEEFGKGIAREELGKLTSEISLSRSSHSFECSGRREMTRRDIGKLNVVVDALVSVIMNHASSAEKFSVTRSLTWEEEGQEEEEEEEEGLFKADAVNEEDSGRRRRRRRRRKVYSKLTQ